MRSSSTYKLIFVILLVLQLGLVWAYPRFATNDGPSHLYNAAVIAGLRFGSWSGISSFYRLNPRPVPNLTTYVILVQLMKEFSPPIAEKILVTGYFVLFTLSFWWVINILRPDSEHFLVWGLVLASNWFIALGFYNFCYGLTFFLLCYGYWLKSRRHFGARQWLILFLLASLLYFSHIFCFLMASFLIGITGLIAGLRECQYDGQRSGTFGDFKNAIVRPVIIPLLCFLPYLLLNPFRAVGSQYVSESVVGQPIARIILGKLFIVRVLYVLMESHDSLAKGTVFAIGLFIVLATYRIFKLPQEPKSAVSYGLGVFSVICLALYIVGPSSFSGGGLLQERAAWFVLWGTFAWLASREWSTGGKRVVVSVSAIVCATGLLNGAIWRRDVSSLLRSYDEAARLVEPNKTLLSLCYCGPWNSNPPVLFRLRIWPLEHAGDITALAARDFSIANYEATGSSFPVEYLPEVNPAIHATTLMENAIQPQIADIADYEAKVGKSVDYVLLWGGPERNSQKNSESTLDKQLVARYTLIYTAPAPSLLRLFRKT